MKEVVDAMAQADPYACELFVERQNADEMDSIIEGMEALCEHVWKAQMKQPDKLMAYKFPSQHEPLPANVSQVVLEASVMHDGKAIDDVLASLSFENLVTINSLSHLLKDAAVRRRHRATKNAGNGG